MAAFVERRLIPAGPAYLAHVLRAVHELSFEEHDKHMQEEQQRRRNLEQEADEEDDFGVGDEQENEDLLSLDPKEWKVSRRILSSTAVVLCPILFLETRSLCCPWSVTS
jgi:DnaJ homolog subfamily C member 2